MLLLLQLLRGSVVSVTRCRGLISLLMTSLNDVYMAFGNMSYTHCCTWSCCHCYNQANTLGCCVLLSHLSKQACFCVFPFLYCLVFPLVFFFCYCVVVVLAGIFEDHPEALPRCVPAYPFDRSRGPEQDHAGSAGAVRAGILPRFLFLFGCVVKELARETAR